MGRGSSAPARSYHTTNLVKQGLTVYGPSQDSSILLRHAPDPTMRGPNDRQKSLVLFGGERRACVARRRMDDVAADRFKLPGAAGAVGRALHGGRRHRCPFPVDLPTPVRTAGPAVCR